MKCLKLLFTIVAFASTVTVSVLAQLSITNPYKIQLDVGIGSTFHYNPPAFKKICFEGCLQEQSSGIGLNMEMSLYRRISERSEIKIGMGYNQISFLERTTDPFLPESYEKLHKYRFMTFAIGHRMTFANQRKVRPFFENNLIFDALIKKDQDIRRVNCAYKFDAGVLIELKNNAYLNVNAFFKTATDTYNLSSTEQYKPYSYGIEFGLGKKSFSLH